MEIKSSQKKTTKNKKKVVRDQAFYSKIGKKGGATVRDKYGPEFFSQIGRKGGQTVNELYGPEYYSAIAQEGAKKRRELINDAQ